MPQIVPTAALSLVEAFGEIPDPRNARGIRHGVSAIMLLGACAVLTGARSFAAIAEYAHDTGRVHPRPARRRRGGAARVDHPPSPARPRPGRRRSRDALLGAGPTRRPTGTRGCPGAGAAPGPGPGRQDRARRPPPRDRHRGDGGDGGYRQPHLVSVLDQASGAVLGQVAVAEKGNEIAAFTTLLDELDLTDVLVTADAAPSNRNHADYLHERGGHYLLTAKLNQCATRRSVTSPLEAGQTRREVCWV